MRLPDLVRLVVLAAIWGGSYLFMRILSPVLGPASVASFRLLLGGAALLLLVRPPLRHWRLYVVVGLLNSAIPFFLYAFAALHIPAAYSAILNSSSTFFAAIAGVIWLGEKMTLRKIAGLILGICGVAVILGVGPIPVTRMVLLAGVACLGSTICYSLAGVYIKLRSGDAEPRAVATASQLFAGLSLLPFVAVSPPGGPVDAKIAGALLALGLLCSGVAYLLYFRLIANVGPTKTVTVTFLIPIFGTLWGVLFLGEQVTWTMAAGATLVLGGVAMSVLPPRVKPTVVPVLR